MRWITIISATLLLALGGCAHNRARPNLDAAPSSQVGGLEAGNPGWSVPPGASSYGSPPPDGQRPDGSEVGAAGVAAAPQVGTSASGADQPPPDSVVEHPVAPLVPAFPVRMRQESLPRLDRVFFGFDRWAITPEMARVLDRNAKWILAHPEAGIRVEGHTDERGTPEYNLSLGQRRANSVRDYLIRKGVPPASLATVSFGEEMPLVRGHTEEAWHMNRRVEFSKSEHPQISEGAHPTQDSSGKL